MNPLAKALQSILVPVEDLKFTPNDGAEQELYEIKEDLDLIGCRLESFVLHQNEVLAENNRKRETLLAELSRIADDDRHQTECKMRAMTLAANLEDLKA